MSRKAIALRTIVWILFLVVVAWQLYLHWIPELHALQNPLWDESDRARDAMDFTYALRTFDLLWILNQSVFFQTWGPLFAVGSQIPILIFGPEARALSFMTFFSFVGTGAIFFWSLRKSLGALAAVAISAFSYLWLASFEGFGSYWIIFMLEGWVILSWTGIALAGVTGSLPLLAVSLWVLFLTKFQYFPVLFLAVVGYLLIHRRHAIVPFLKSLVAGRVAKVILLIFCLLMGHITIMKILGPVYGKSTWNGYRAIRNPLVVSWELFCLLLFLKRSAVFQYLVTEPWERKLTRWFFWPAFLLMAFPWPNRWGAVLFTSNAGEKIPLSETLRIYTSAIWNAWSAPQVFSYLFIALIAGALVCGLVWFNRYKRVQLLERLKTPHFLVVLIFAIVLVIQLVGVNNTQPRFAWAMASSIGIGLFAFILSQTRGVARLALAGTATLAIVAAFSFTDYFSPERYFLRTLNENVGQPFKDHPALFPLEKSLSPILERAAGEKKTVHFGVLQNVESWYWDLPLRYWLVQNKIKTGIQSHFTILTPQLPYCELAAKAGLQMILQSVDGKWVEVSCESKKVSTR